MAPQHFKLIFSKYFSTIYKEAEVSMMAKRLWDKISIVNKMAGKASREIETSCETIESIEADPYDKECPMVFYCNKCSAIIGDSFSWLCVNKGIQAVVLQSKITLP